MTREYKIKRIDLENKISFDEVSKITLRLPRDSSVMSFGFVFNQPVLWMKVAVGNEDIIPYHFEFYPASVKMIEEEDEELIFINSANCLIIYNDGQESLELHLFIRHKHPYNVRKENESLSAYEIAVKRGYKGSRDEWLESLSRIDTRQDWSDRLAYW